MDYNMVEHCCACAGCYESESHVCPDYSRFEDEDYDPDTDERGCKITDPFYCDTCGEEVKTGTYHIVHVNIKDGKIIDVGGDGSVDDKIKNSNVIAFGFWFCHKHDIIDNEDGVIHDEGYNKLSSLIKRRMNHLDDGENVSFV